MTSLHEFFYTTWQEYWQLRVQKVNIPICTSHTPITPGISKSCASLHFWRQISIFVSLSFMHILDVGLGTLLHPLLLSYSVSFCQKFVGVSFLRWLLTLISYSISTHTFKLILCFYLNVVFERCGKLYFPPMVTTISSRLHALLQGELPISPSRVGI